MEVLIEDLHLAREVVAVGRVVDEEGHGVPGAEVSLEERYLPAPRSPHDARTDARGFFVLAGLGGPSCRDGRIVAVKQGFAGARSSRLVFRTGGNTVEVGNLVLPRAVPLRVRVLDRRGTRWPGRASGCSGPEPRTCSTGSEPSYGDAPVRSNYI